MEIANWFYILQSSGRQLEDRRKLFRQDSLDCAGGLILRLRRFSLMRYWRLVRLIRKLERKMKMLLLMSYNRWDYNRNFMLHIEAGWLHFYRQIEEKKKLTNGMIVLEKYLRSKMIEAARECRKKNALTVEQYIKLCSLSDDELFDGEYYDENGDTCSCIMYVVCDCC